jgi:predicted transcriptional regulator
MNLDQFKGYTPPAVDQYIFQLEAANKRLHNELMKVISSNAGWMNEAKELQAEKQQLLETLEEIICCAENVLITYADTNQLIIDMARQAQKGAGDETS